MAAYKARLSADLERWIDQGLVAAESRQPILDSVTEARRIDAGVALAIMGAILAGLAAIAFVAANWDAIPRLARFALILAVFAATAAAAAWGAARGRPLVRDILLGVAALIYAGAIGLTGQIFDLAGDPQAALRGAGLAAILLALAGRSNAAAIAAVALIGLGDFAGPDGLFDLKLRWLALAAPAAALLAVAWRSRSLAHLAGPAMVVGWLFATSDVAQAGYLALAGAFAAAALAARWGSEQERPATGVLYGWMCAGALLAFAVAGFSDDTLGLIHRLAWLILSGAAIALGLHDRAPAVTAVGVLSAIGAVSAILMDLGLGLMTAAGVFAGCALLALAAGALLRRKRAKT
ncbi:DUF2157 domain-containing protein [Phenylobacterium sp.]|uniref:DUF2157 domain-containing protein n=1 Tax=Phenylobacterium sp. TaxID=1871053 RepID=UPI0027319E85|nr:DUF2157 domain-containing protein [Phenylobacterium sp.]MDP2215047.1 DUF2157 domain-containing protein [Phenylobacterium sp.]